MAGFEVSTYGRFWVSTEGEGSEVRLLSRSAVAPRRLGKGEE